MNNSVLWAIAAASFAAIFALDAPFPVIVAGAALIGYIGGHIAPARFGIGSGHGKNVLWPTGFAGAFDWPSASIALVAAMALFRFKRDVMQVIAACAGVGLVLKTLIG